MSTVRDAASLLVEGALGELNEKQRRLLTIILERTETWLRLVDEVLVLPQWAAEGSLLHYQNVSLRELVSQSIEKTRGLALFREVTVHMMISDALPKVTVDQPRLVQALTILLAAVISATKQGGQIRLSASLLSETEVQIEVFGAGTMGAVEEGMGMAFVRAIVEAHGGLLRTSLFESVNGFCAFTLPLQASVTREERSHVKSTHR